jgi:uncharacterized protein (TIGR03118 family)
MLRDQVWPARAGVGLALLAALCVPARADIAYLQTNLRSSVAGLDPSGVGDPDLKNPWGISNLPGSPYWVSDQVTGKATLYNGLGTKQALVVTVPGGNPTGQVANTTTSDFALPVGGKALFIFATLGGSIEGWNGGSGTTAQVVATTPSSAYTGLTLANNGAANFLYAANARANRVDVFDSSLHLTTLSGNFVDPNVPAGLTPYGIQNIGSSIFVTYDRNGVASGVVAQFDHNGNFIREIGSSANGVPLNEPWGVALAPSGFGPFGGDLLVGNQGDGRILAFNPNSGAFLGFLLGTDGNPIANSGLWGLTFGNGASNSDPNTLYFVAGINGETDGLFGTIQAVPEPSSMALVVIGSVGLAAWRRRRRSAA